MKRNKAANLKLNLAATTTTTNPKQQQQPDFGYNSKNTNNASGANQIDTSALLTPRITNLLAEQWIKFNSGVNSVKNSFMDRIFFFRKDSNGSRVGNRKKSLFVICDSDLEVLDEIGAGVSGTVAKCKHKKTGCVMAKKIIKLECSKSKVHDQILRELTILIDCHSPHIVTFYGAYAFGADIHICMEYMNGGACDNLIKRLARVPELVLAKVGASVLDGLDYLHAKHAIMHRDVKPSNILVNSRGQIKLCDMGVSGKLVNSMAHTFIGTRPYMSPERLEGRDYTAQSDVWSLGITLIEMAVGKYPIPKISHDHIVARFDQQPSDLTPTVRTAEEQSQSVSNSKDISIFEQLELIINQPAPTLPIEFFKPECVDFIDLCLQKSEEKRASIKTLLSHPFLKEHDNESPYFYWFHRLIELGVISGEDLV